MTPSTPLLTSIFYQGQSSPMPLFGVFGTGFAMGLPPYWGGSPLFYSSSALLGNKGISFHRKLLPLKVENSFKFSLKSSGGID